MADHTVIRLDEQDLALVSRIADALGALVTQNAEDLAFRREQAEKSEQQQATFLQMFLGAAQPQRSPDEKPRDSAVATRRKRRAAEGK
jgi:hypothetical protein